MFSTTSTKSSQDVVPAPVAPDGPENAPRAKRSWRTPFLVVVSFALAGAVILIVPPAEAQSSPQNTYAAIAFSKSTGRWGWGSNYYTEQGAEQQALQNCNTDDARVVAWVRNGYVALALGDDLGVYGWAWDTNQENARYRALREAQKRTTNCYVPVLLSSYDTTNYAQ